MTDELLDDKDATKQWKEVAWKTVTVVTALAVVWLLYSQYTQENPLSRAMEDSYSVQAYRVNNDRAYDIDCMDFESSASAQLFLDVGKSVHGDSADLFRLDPNGNGIACDAIYNPVTGGAAWEDISLGVSTGGVRVWLDRGVDCSAFSTHDDAQYYFNSLGGPAYDPFNLDDDDDGRACELLP